MRTSERLRNQHGGAGAWILTIFILLVVGIGAFLLLVNQGIIEAPEFLASIPGMEAIIPAEEPEELPSDTLEASTEDVLRRQVLDLRRQNDGLQSQIAALNEQLEQKDRAVQEREDEIARLMDAINLGRNQNINNVALIYENMDPEEASVILANLGALKASMIIGAMRESKAADVLALMDERLATEITELIAGFEGEGEQPLSGRSTTSPGQTTSEGRAVEGSPSVPAPSTP